MRSAEAYEPNNYEKIEKPSGIGVGRLIIFALKQAEKHDKIQKKYFDWNQANLVNVNGGNFNLLNTDTAYYNPTSNTLEIKRKGIKVVVFDLSIFQVKPVLNKPIEQVKEENQTQLVTNLKINELKQEVSVSPVEVFVSPEEVIVTKQPQKITPETEEIRGNKYIGIVDYLESKGISSSRENRKILAEQYGVQNYKFTSSQNNKLLGLIKASNITESSLLADRVNAAIENKINTVGFDIRNIVGAQSQSVNGIYYCSGTTRITLESLGAQNPAGPASAIDLLNGSSQINLSLGALNGELKKQVRDGYVLFDILINKGNGATVAHRMTALYGDNELYSIDPYYNWTRERPLLLADHDMRGQTVTYIILKGYKVDNSHLKNTMNLSYNDVTGKKRG